MAKQIYDHSPQLFPDGLPLVSVYHANHPNSATLNSNHIFISSACFDPVKRPSTTYLCRINEYGEGEMVEVAEEGNLQGNEQAFHDNELFAVLAHEMAHIAARHRAESLGIM